ncbi:DUF7521 family protein [Natranaeroarchaeum aerophilus]|uniref:Uncharacterized protein n=1 Tax=Natranaeroarchaeum aerophilus TaxID=2917711 RepID=A0AAE3FUL3_9EURY|nr:hypothetical protein [Natranaeroarchaeum aerophilus]MCL9815240.1 hypothetical protein [Natranaeroarchaeum aerophilus]
MMTEAVLSAIETELGGGATIFLVALTSATLGGLVAGLAYRGYRRNESQPMFYLAIGVAFLTVVPFVLSYSIDGVTNASDAQILLVITVCHLTGLLAIAHSLRRP